MAKKAESKKKKYYYDKKQEAEKNYDKDDECGC